MPRTKPLTAPGSTVRRFMVLALVAVLTGAGLSCAVNPATGERELSLISRDEEIQMGREAHPQILETMGVYPDSVLQGYVSELGQEMAAASERPDLPWTFTVVDEPVVNAFALPGGFIYLTRGILAHFDTEAELAAVLGHEIGHVTARHSVHQMSQARLARLGLGLGSAFVPELRPFEQVAGVGLQLLMLKFGRDDEREADDLGYRYMTRQGYDPEEMVDVFRMLSRASSGGGSVPGWLSTHPDPENRQERIQERIAGDPGDYSDALVRRSDYLRRIDGVVFGVDPRQGYFLGPDFYHPELAFQISFPEGWSTANRASSVQAVSSNQDALVGLRFADASSASAGLRSFLSQEGVRRGTTSERQVNGLPAARAEFTAATREGDELSGRVIFVEYGGRVYRILGITPTALAAERGPAIRSSMQSFAPLRDQRLLSVAPDRLRVVETDREISFREFLERYPSSPGEEAMARINQVELDETLPAGRLVKSVEGGEQPERP